MTYTEPTAADLAARYPAFAQVDPTVAAYWLTDAHRYVDQTWLEDDYAPALIAVAAHNMIGAGVAGIATSEVVKLAASGLTEFRSAGFNARFSEAAATQAAEGGWSATVYGREYLDLLAKNRGGPRVTSPGAVCCNDGFNGFTGPLGYPARLFPC